MDLLLCCESMWWYVHVCITIYTYQKGPLVDYIFNVYWLLQLFEVRCAIYGCLVLYYTHNILLPLTKQNDNDNISIHALFVLSWLNMSVIWFSYCSSISCPDVCITCLTIFLSIFVKWHVTATNLLSIVHFPVCFATVLSVVCCHAFV